MPLLAGALGHRDVADVQVDLRAQKQMQRQRLGPELTFDVEDHGVVAHFLLVDHEAHLHGVRKDPGLEVANTLAQEAFEFDHVDRTHCMT